MEQAEASRAVFHSYLRAFYPFLPTGDVSPSTIILPLDQGDIILVHSVHTNGWADGTLLDTGYRGWLPTNYCEKYDQFPMRPLLKALTDCWDIMRGGCGSSLKDFSNQDLTQGLIAGVRLLLERSECLTREAPLVKKYDVLRRIRKALLSSLSSFVRTAQRFRHVANGAPMEDEVEAILDEMLLKAFKIVTCGVRFLDIWNDEVGLSRTIAKIETAGTQFDIPPTKRILVSPRVSSSGPSSTLRVHNLASERLETTYDALLDALGAFIGIHLQHSPAIPTITQQAVQSCQALLNVIDTVCEHNSQRTRLLHTARESMREKLSELVHAARDMFQPDKSHDDDDDNKNDLVFIPHEGKRMVDAATDCVCTANNCLVEARLVLQQIGDIELDSQSLQSATSREHLDATDFCLPETSILEQEFSSTIGSEPQYVSDPVFSSGQHSTLDTRTALTGLTAPTAPISSESETDDRQTIYSDTLTKEAYVDELAHELFKAVSSFRLDSASMKHVADAMPDCLKAFSSRLGCFGSTEQVQQDVTVFIHKYRQ
ncbi:hypothetical protein N7447_007536 [Penicillium robsamsonii]|uniref:uncharacterized protein n=1 Tax=Penicillium robsamsonii TaxID=1792511 RepID=UPI0025494C9E|nr:uncharacterized protein N7447_007536 [Penicillium robsamsonii]KAJ5817528.1 hypothetical protein N7447_007536 [Penicillium robsamsonii]